MKKGCAFIVAYLLIGLLSGLLTAGWAFAYFQGKYPTLADKNVRSDSAAGVGVWVFTVITWPISVPEYYLLSGYAKYGWRALWDLRKGGNHA